MELSGVIKGDQQDIIADYMISTVNTIREELLMNFPPNLNEFYIYTKYNPKKLTLKIFVNLLKNTQINHRDIDINFLITLDDKYPSKAPLVFCITDVRKNTI